MHRPVKSLDYARTVKQGYQLPLLRHLNVDRYLNRPAGALITKAVYRTGVTPNQLTYFSFALLIVAAALICVDDRRYVLAGAVVQLVAAFFDSADGMLARAKGLSSRFGGTLDLVLDRIGDAFLYGSTVAAYYHATGDARLAIAGLVGLAMFNLQVTLYYLVEQYRKADRTGMSGETRALMSWLIVACVLAGRLEILMWLMIIEPVANIAYRVWYFHHLPKAAA